MNNIDIVVILKKIFWFMVFYILYFENKGGGIVIFVCMNFINKRNQNFIFELFKYIDI